MKKAFTSLLILSGLVGAQAQVSLTKAQVPASGTVFLNYDANVPSTPFTFSKTGSANVWDFTQVPAVLGEDDTIYFVNPALVPGNDKFPTATGVRYEGGDDSYVFYRTQDDGLYYLGIGTDPNNSGEIVGLPANKPFNNFPFPYTVNSKVNGEVLIVYKASGVELGRPSIDSVALNTSSNVTREVVASGQIILPSGIYDAFLEKQVTIATTEVYTKVLGFWSPTPIISNTATDSSYAWYTNESLEPYANVVFTNGQISDVTYHKTTLVITGLPDKENKITNLISYPNPAKESLTLVIEANEIHKVELVAVEGSLIRTIEMPSSIISVSDLIPGIYSAKVYTSNGKIFVSRFVKQ